MVQPDDDETTTPFIDIPASESTAIHNQEDALEHFTRSSLEAERRELLKTKVDAFLKVVAKNTVYYPGRISTTSLCSERMGELFLKDGLIRVTWKNGLTRYLALKNSDGPTGSARICFPNIQ